MTQTSNYDEQLRVYAHQGVLIFRPSGGKHVSLRFMTGDRAVLNSNDLRTLIGLLIGELVRTMEAERQ